MQIAEKKTLPLPDTNSIVVDMPDLPDLELLPQEGMRPVRPVSQFEIRYTLAEYLDARRAGGKAGQRGRRIFTLRPLLASYAASAVFSALLAYAAYAHQVAGNLQAVIGGLLTALLLVLVSPPLARGRSIVAGAISYYLTLLRTPGCSVAFDDDYLTCTSRTATMSFSWKTVDEVRCYSSGYLLSSGPDAIAIPHRCLKVEHRARLRRIIGAL